MGRHIVGIVALTVSVIGCDLPKMSTEQITAEKRQDAQFGSERDAKVAAEKFVKQSLKHPLDASFNWDKHASLVGEGDQRTWLVSGSVKAKNSFGGELTHLYNVRLTYRDSTWAAVAVAIDGKLVHIDPDAAPTTASAPVAPVARAPSPSATAGSSTANSSTIVPRPIAAPTAIVAAAAMPAPTPIATPAPSATVAVRKKPWQTSRSWTQINGVTVNGSLKEWTASRVVIIRDDDGTEFVTTKDNLSNRDQNWVKGNMR